MPSPLTDKKLRIALLGYRSHPYVGGQGIYLNYLSRALTQLGHQVTVFSGQPYPDLDKNITLVKVPGLNLYESANPFGELKFSHLFSLADTTEWVSKMTGGFAEPYCFGLRVKRLIRPGQFDVIHDNQSLCYSLIALQKHTPVLSTIHHPIHRDRKLALDDAPNIFHKMMRARWYQFLNMQQKVVNKLHFITTVSKQSQKDISHFFKRHEQNCIYIPNGIDTTIFSPSKHTVKKPFQIITTTSSDQPLKGLRFLLHALSELCKTYPDVKLIIVGTLNKKGECFKLVKSLKLSQNIIFEKRISTDRLVELYRQSSVAVCPSLYEGFGLPAAEAMSCGCAVISTDGGALPEIVGDAGIIVKAGSAVSIAQALNQLFSNPCETTNLGIKARNRIIKLFSWERVAHSLIFTYRHMISQQHVSDAQRNDTFHFLSKKLHDINDQSQWIAPNADD